MATDSDSNEANGIPRRDDRVVDGDGDVFRREFEIERGCWSIYLYWQAYRVGHLYGIEGATGVISLKDVILEDALPIQQSTVLL